MRFTNSDKSLIIKTNLSKFQRSRILTSSCTKDTAWAGKNTKNRVSATLNASFRGKNETNK